VEELNIITIEGFESSCKHTSNTLTVKLHISVLPDGSVAVHTTVVVPAGNIDPDGGLHTTVVPGQASVTVGGGYVTTTCVSPGDAVTAV
jgi:hypothetical protein